MIQRIQSVYLLLVTVLLLIILCLPIGNFIDLYGVAHPFTLLGVEANGANQSTWGLFCITLLSSIIAFVTIFLFKNRMLQIRFTIFNSILLVGLYIAIFVFYYSLKKYFVSFQIHWILSFPLIAMILNYLAVRAIGSDEVKVKSADRLWKKTT